MANLKNFFYKKKILITGHTGFKGSWLTLWLKNYDAKIFGISKDIPTKPAHFNVSKLYKGIKNYQFDILDQKKLKKTFLKIKPDYVFHLAAQSLVKKSYEDPTLTWNTNLIGTLNILESLRALNKSCTAVLITSDKCYFNKETHKGYKESDTLGGEDPYSASKASAEILIKSYIKSFFNKKKSSVKISSVRAGNVIGGGDWSKNRLIPDCVTRWSANKTVKIRNPFSTRPWQHVLEAIYGYVLLATKLSKNSSLHGESFNFGPSNNSNYNVIYLIKTTKKFWKNIKWSVVISKKKLFKESNLLRLNTQKVRKTIKWKSILKFEECIAMTINWYRDFYLKSKDMNALSLQQIKEYQKLLTKRELE
jgi:CDP-glucose 4,6-dehydratase